MSITDQTAKSPSVEGMLDVLYATGLVGKNQGIREHLLALKSRLSSGQLHVAVLGQMKRGKSSLINALLKSKVLPTGVLPATAIITKLRYGQAATATVIYSTGSFREPVAFSALSDYITESGNPANRKQVAFVEITYPSPFLESGIILIDTPGIGSTHAHNTDTTERYLSQIDAGIVVLSVDPPPTEVESKFIRELIKEMPKLLFVVNKIDIASPTETAEIVGFVERELRRIEVRSPEIFPLSTRLDHIEDSPAENGLQIFEQRLQTFLQKEKLQTLNRSVAMDILEVVRTLRFCASIGEKLESMSKEELYKRRQAFERVMEHVQNEIRELQLLLRQRSSDLLANIEHDLAAQVRDSVPEVQEHLGHFQSEHPRVTGRTFGKLLETFLMKEIEGVFNRWRVREDDKVQKDLADLAERFVTRANNILASLEESVGTLFEIPIEHLSIRCSLTVESHLYFRVEPIFYSLDSFLLLLPRFLLRPIVLRRTRKNIQMHLDMNAGRIRYDYIERLETSVHHFEQDILQSLKRVTDGLRAVFDRQSDSEHHGDAALVRLLDSIAHDCVLVLH